MKYKSTFIIAEAGVNHNGDIRIARKLIDAAQKSGADAVKFQTFTAERLVTKGTRKAEYQKQTTNAHESQFEMLKGLELNEKDFIELKQVCSQRGILFLSSPFDIESARLLKKLDVSIFKIPSGEITNYPYLKEIGKLNRELLLSTGMSDLGEIEDALDVLTHFGTPLHKITVLHCNTQYPTPFKDVNLKAMRTIQAAFHVDVGYSDHTLGIEVPIAAVAMGAKVIEKHFTLDRSMKGPDHRASLEPVELKNMVHAIRNIESALGTGLKQPSDSERKNIGIVRKRIVALKTIKKGELFSEKNIGVKRAAGGASPMRWEEIIGKRAVRVFNIDEPIVL